MGLGSNLAHDLARSYVAAQRTGQHEGPGCEGTAQDQSQHEGFTADCEKIGALGSKDPRQDEHA